MPDDEADRAARLLLKALDSLSDRDRRFVTQALLAAGISTREAGRGSTSASVPVGLMDPGFPMRISRQVDQPLLVRLPSDLHARLRRWATDHGFSMAGIVRGLVERFLDEQEGRRPQAR